MFLCLIFTSHTYAQIDIEKENEELSRVALKNFENFRLSWKRSNGNFKLASQETPLINLEKGDYQFVSKMLALYGLPDETEARVMGSELYINDASGKSVVDFKSLLSKTLYWNKKPIPLQFEFEDSLATTYKNIRTQLSREVFKQKKETAFLRWISKLAILAIPFEFLYAKGSGTSTFGGLASTLGGLFKPSGSHNGYTLMPDGKRVYGFGTVNLKSETQARAEAQTRTQKGFTGHIKSGLEATPYQSGHVTWQLGHRRGSSRPEHVPTGATIISR